MSEYQKRYAELLLEWARTLPEHKDMDYESWIARRMGKWAAGLGAFRGSMWIDLALLFLLFAVIHYNITL